MYVPPGFAVVFPYLAVRGADDYIAFLAQAFGVEEIGRTVMDGRIANAELDLAGSRIFLGEARSDADLSRVGLYLYVEDAEATMARALAAGATLLSEVADQFYGDRQGGVVDRCGITWWISQRTVQEPYRH